MIANHLQVPSIALTRATTNYSLRIPQGWKKAISEGDQHWIGKAVFASKGTLQTTLQLWYHPPPPPSSGIPDPEAYHRKPLFLWMPRRMWQIAFSCSQCSVPDSLR